MTDGGFLAEQPNVKAPETLPPPPESGGEPVIAEDEVAQAERQAMEQVRALEQEKTFLEEGETSSVVPAEQAGSATTPTVTVVAKDEVVREVEKILGEGLEGFYRDMPDDAKLRFRQKGEETAVEIASMVRRFHIKVKQLLLLIRNWLLTIPGINKFFLEQEAKIKTDQILELERARQEQSQNQSV